MTEEDQEMKNTLFRMFIRNMSRVRHVKLQYLHQVCAAEEDSAKKQNSRELKLNLQGD